MNPVVLALIMNRSMFGFCWAMPTELHQVLHQVGPGNALVGLGGNHDKATVFRGNETLGDSNEEIARGRKNDQGDQHGYPFIAEHGKQTAIVQMHHPLVAGLGQLVQSGHAQGALPREGIGCRAWAPGSG